MWSLGVRKAIRYGLGRGPCRMSWMTRRHGGILSRGRGVK